MKTVLFDLDGTLCDSEVGIGESLIFAMRQMGYSVPSASQIRGIIGPPFGFITSCYDLTYFFLLGLLKVKSLVVSPEPIVTVPVSGRFLNFSCQQTISYFPAGIPSIEKLPLASVTA